LTSKNRAGGESQALDHYCTPIRHTLAILEHVTHGVPLLDPCAGEGRILEAAEIAGYAEVHGIEVQPQLAAQAAVAGYGVLIADALAPDLAWPEVPLIVMNPPYTHAEAFVRKALATVTPKRGTVAALLRLGWLAGKGRGQLFAEIGLPDVYVVPRPSFCLSVKCACGWRATYPTGTPRKSITCGNAQLDHARPCTRSRLSFSTSDSADYAWFVWSTMWDLKGRESLISRLDLPEDEAA
jgi:hypothetical protein